MKLFKKAITNETLIRLVIVSAVLLLIVTPLGSKAMAAFRSYSDQKYYQSFEEFVEEGIKQQKGAKETYSLLMKKGSALVGFQSNLNQYHCAACNGPSLSFSVNKPKDKCGDSSCLCLCNNFDFKGKEGMCKVTWVCKTFTKQMGDQFSSATQNEQNTMPFETVQQQSGSGGFFYAYGVQGVDSLQQADNLNYFTVDQTGTVIGVCSGKILQHQKTNLKIDSCIIPAQKI